MARSRNANGPCGACRHHVSVHKYDPEKPRSGPQKCEIPGCTCHEYIRPMAALKRQWTIVSNDALMDDQLRNRLLPEIEANIARAEKAQEERREHARQERQKAREEKRQAEFRAGST